MIAELTAEVKKLEAMFRAIDETGDGHLVQTAVSRSNTAELSG